MQNADDNEIMQLEIQLQLALDVITQQIDIDEMQQLVQEAQQASARRLISTLKNWADLPAEVAAALADFETYH